MLPPFTVFDVETTGLDPKRGHRIVELAGVRVENGQILEATAFTSLVNPERTIPLEAQRINHISDQDVANAPTIMHVLPEFLTFAQGSILVAHNAQFDMGFMQMEKEFCWGYVELPECFCTMRLSQNLFPTAFRHNLDVLSERFNMPLPENRHRALPDVIQTAKLLIKMIDHAKITSISELRTKAAILQAARV